MISEGGKDNLKEAAASVDVEERESLDRLMTSFEADGLH